LVTFLDEAQLVRNEKLVGGEFVADVPLVGKRMPLVLFEDEDDDEEDVDEVELDVEEEVG
jgi:hypothetical protein